MKKLLNPKQKLVLITVFVAYLALGFFPPWRYLDGRSAGFHPLTSPLKPLPTSIAPGEPTREYMPYQMVPNKMAASERKEQFTENERRKPFIDVRKMLSIATVLFFIAVAFIFFFVNRNAKRSIATSVKLT